MTYDLAALSFPPEPLAALSPLARWQGAAKATTIDALLGGARSLGVVVPHADDETLGCGGLIAAAAAGGLDVMVTVLTDGAASHPGSRRWPPALLRQQRQAELAAAVALLTAGRGRVHHLGHPDGRLSEHPEASDAIPPADLLVTCWRGDPHPDHQAAFAITVAAARRLGVPLLAFPLWVLTTADPIPDGLALARIDVARWLAVKQRALAEHRSQLGELIDDDPDGFVLDAGLQALFVRGDELYLVIPPV